MHEGCKGCKDEQNDCSKKELNIMIENIEGSCEGCIDNHPNDGIYDGTPDCSKKELIEPCPCKICLIKVMCRLACKEYRDYAIRHKEELVHINRGIE